jgi:hypothetical protein
MFGNLTLLKQWNFHWQFHCRCFGSRSLNVCKPKIDDVAWDYFKKKLLICCCEAKTNLHWKVVLPLSLVLPGKYILPCKDPPSTWRDCTWWERVKCGCVCVKCLFLATPHNLWSIEALLVRSTNNDHICTMCYWLFPKHPHKLKD